MKKLFLVIAALLGCNVLLMAGNDQATESKITWHVKAAMNLSNWRGVDEINTKAKVGYKLGGGLEYGLNKTWAIQPSLFLTSKGAKAGDSGEEKTTINQVYLELPVNMQVRIPVASNTNVLIAAGPYFAYGIAGKISQETDGVKSSVDTFDNDMLEFKKFDAGIGAGVSLEINKIMVGLDGQLGLTRITKEKLSEDSPKNINFSLSVGYKF